MKIAYVITRADSVGGASIHVRDLGRAMIERGHIVKVFLGGSGPVTDQLAAAGIPFHSLQYLQRAIHPLTDYSAFRELASALRVFTPTLVSTHTAKAGWIGRAVCRHLRVPVMYTPHGWAISDRLSTAEGAIYSVAERVAARWSDAIICVSEFERRLALERRIARPELLHVIHNCVHDVPRELRSNPGGEPVRIISVARFDTSKDHRTLFEALARLLALRWELELVGDGPEEGAMRALANRLGIASRTRFAGYMADPAPALARAQLFVLSSRFEGFPRSILEAMRAGLPVIASNVGGVAEAVRSGETGILVPRDSAEALRAGIKVLIENKLQRQLFGRTARQTYDERFTFDRMITATNAVYATVVGVGHR